MSDNNNKFMPSKANQCNLPSGRLGGGRVYVRPTFEIIDIDTSQVICQSIQNNAGLGNGGGSGESGQVQGRAARMRDWQEWEGTY